jgi:hypothetical protein
MTVTYGAARRGIGVPAVDPGERHALGDGLREIAREATVRRCYPTEGSSAQH